MIRREIKKQRKRLWRKYLKDNGLLPQPIVLHSNNQKEGRPNIPPVCPPMAEAMVRANLPEYCGATIITMAQLNDLVAV